MAQALIRNLDDDLLEDYRQAAKRNGHSLEAELRNGLAKSRPKHRLSAKELTAVTHALWEQIPESARASSLPYIRAMRDGR